MIASKERGLRTIEVSALRIHEFESALSFLDEVELLDFDYVSFHLPSMLSVDEQGWVAKMIRRPWQKDLYFVAHPDAVSSFGVWRPFGERLVIENMDARKPGGRTLSELDELFSNLPEAGLCLDVAHARRVDPTMNLVTRIARRFGARIRQYHLSDVDSSGRHRRLSWPAIRAFRSVAHVLPQAPVILESPLVDDDSLEAEVNAAKAVWGPVGPSAATVYVSSKIKHAEMWRNLRLQGWNISSSWIDQPKEFDSGTLSGMWDRYVEECRSCDFLLVYREPGEQLKGALIEVGAALAGGAKVIVIGDVPELGTSHYHPLVAFAGSIDQALNQIQRATCSG